MRPSIPTIKRPGPSFRMRCAMESTSALLSGDAGWGRGCCHVETDRYTWVLPCAGITAHTPTTTEPSLTSAHRWDTWGSGVRAPRVIGSRSLLPPRRCWTVTSAQGVRRRGRLALGRGDSRDAPEDEHRGPARPAASACSGLPLHAIVPGGRLPSSVGPLLDARVGILIATKVADVCIR